MGNSVKLLKTLKIGFDLDGVIIDHTWTKIQQAELLGFNIKPEETPGQRLRKIIGQASYRRVQKYIYGPGTAGGLVSRGAFPVLKRIKELGYQMFVISRRGTEFQSPGLVWLMKNMSGIFDRTKILFVKRDYDKDMVCQKLKIQIYLDDKASVLSKLRSVSKKILYDPYNIGSDHYQTVSSWKEFLSILTWF